MGGSSHTRAHASPCSAPTRVIAAWEGGACRAGAARAREPGRCPDRQGPRLQDKPHRLRPAASQPHGRCVWTIRPQQELRAQLHHCLGFPPADTPIPQPRHPSKGPARGHVRTAPTASSTPPPETSAVRACGRHTGRWPSGAPARAATRLSPPSPAALAGDGPEPRGRHGGTAGPKAGREGRGQGAGPWTEQAAPHTLGVSGLPTHGPGRSPPVSG